ncbi:MAG: sodium:proton antiporter [Candidatus Dadabacteria bacterium]|nr:MAG: sodium:proton antiporter [Candidatus Dadabacteria bacterium]
MILDILSWALLLIGSAACVLAGIGLHRFPDVYSRTHASGVSDTLGVLAILTGLLLQAPSFGVGIKLLMVLGFLWISGPTATHALVQAAWIRGIEPVLGAGPDPFHRDEDGDNTEEVQ